MGDGVPAGNVAHEQSVTNPETDGATPAAPAEQLVTVIKDGQELKGRLIGREGFNSIVELFDEQKTKLKVNAKFVKREVSNVAPPALASTTLPSEALSAAAGAEKQVAIKLEIDPEFKALCPAPTDEELSQLEANLIAEGCRDALVSWNGKLLDGHNRFPICTRRGIPFTTVEVKGVETREQAINWIINNQLGRRNLTPEQVKYLRGKRYMAEKKQGARTDLTSAQNDRKSTDERLAEEYNVAPATIRRDAVFAAATDTITKNVGEGARQEILAGNVSKKDVIAIAKAPPEEQIKLMSSVAPACVPEKKEKAVEAAPQAISTEMSAAEQTKHQNKRARLVKSGKVKGGPGTKRRAAAEAVEKALWASEQALRDLDRALYEARDTGGYERVFAAIPPEQEKPFWKLLDEVLGRLRETMLYAPRGVDDTPTDASAPTP